MVDSWCCHCRRSRKLVLVLCFSGSVNVVILAIVLFSARFNVVEYDKSNEQILTQNSPPGKTSTIVTVPSQANQKRFAAPTKNLSSRPKDYAKEAAAAAAPVQQTRLPRGRRRRQVVMDIVSIGSQTRSDLQKAQQETFASHPAVRHYVPVSEQDDVSDPTCHFQLSMIHLAKVVAFCKAGSSQKWPPVLEKMRQHYATLSWLQRKNRPRGWLCAIKRPVDGFFKAVNAFHYRRFENLPHYLILMDDDTWIHVERVVQYLQMEDTPGKVDDDDDDDNNKSNSKDRVLLPRAWAGCMIRSRVKNHNFTFPFGGYGLILNKMALFNLLRPIHCNSNTSNSSSQSARMDPAIPVTTTIRESNEEDFERLACWRLLQNGIGERALFRNGMSVADLMQAYNRAAPYEDVEHWNHEGGGHHFCLHGDWVWGYFINYYHIVVHRKEAFFAHVLHDRLDGYQQSQIYAGKRSSQTDATMRQCWNSNDFRNKKINNQRRSKDSSNKATERQYCTTDRAHLCHHISADHMKRLHNQL